MMNLISIQLFFKYRLSEIVNTIIQSEPNFQQQAIRLYLQLTDYIIDRIQNLYE